MVGAILLVSALIFGALAGGVVIHRLDTTPTSSNESKQSQKEVEQGDNHSKPAKSKHASQGHSASPEPDDSQDKDA
jgi:hypothetical protein